MNLLYQSLTLILDIKKMDRKSMVIILNIFNQSCKNFMKKQSIL